MCRIAGVISHQEGEEIRSLVQKMSDSMAHGGPDGRGVFQWKGGCLGHRRLSILDLSSLGHQPMSRKDGRYWIVYNGEIYNHLELREELEMEGEFFYSASDTEVILSAYSQWGTEAFSRLKGMFSLGLYDAHERKFFLVRDPMGIKPLYYSKQKGRLIFASEVRAFQVFDSDWSENPKWKILFLLFGYLPEPETTLSNVYSLTPGTWLQWDLESGESLEVCFSNPKPNPVPVIPPGPQKLLRNILTDSVKRHLVADAPLGVFLSGGIDSSLIALLAAQFRGRNLNTLSLIFDEKDYSEEVYQQIIQEKMGGHHRSHRITMDDFFEELPSIFRAYDQPTLDGVNTYFISRGAQQEGLKAVLSGLGGDELFGGYPSFSRLRYLWPLKDSPLLLRWLGKLGRWAPTDKLEKMSFLSLSRDWGFYLLLRGIYSPQEVARLLHGTEREVLESLQGVSFPGISGLGPRNYASSLETFLYMKNQLLKDSDVFGMHHGVEIRVPFLYADLIDYVFSLPERIKFGKHGSKEFLVKSFGSLLPREITHRPKQGFVFPFARWFQKRGREIFSSISPSQSLLTQSQKEDIWDKFNRGKLSWSRLWSLVVLENWK